jgi:NTP pyrophosphatase (non-canonical NTP hydrolase)
MSKMKLNELRDKAYRTACGHGFHDQELSNEHFLCLVISELMEAVEADRRGKRANVDWFEKKISTSRICQGLDPDIPKERGYEVAYNETIKGSIEEELADAVIHLLDLAGLRGISLEPAMKDINSDVIDDSADSCVSETFTETIYAISTLPVRYDGLFDFPTTVNDMIVSIFGLAKHLEIDLFWHIEQKMRYNELREKMHGKKY